jgi:hypothetical protein
MSIASQTFVTVAAVITACLMQPCAAGFVPPADGPVPFRRDKLPLDADAIGSLSRNVESLAQGLHLEGAADRRGAAQMLALALALDPGNSPARKLVSVFQKNTHTPEQDASRIEKSRARIWQCIAWLETAEAGPDGQALAACLQDVMVVSDPKHPKSATLRQAGEKGAWSGWVPALAAYEDGNTIASNNRPGDDEEKPESNPALPAGSLAKATVATVLWQRAGTEDDGDWTLGPADLEMSASAHQPDQESGESARFKLSIGSSGEHGPFDQTAGLITKALETTHGQLPRNLRVRISHSDLDRAVQSRRRLTLSAAGALLANAAITGITPDAIVLGTIEESGAFRMPSSFWDQIQSLGKGSGRRLILPAESATELTSFLALEKPEFFMQYEVILAADLKELIYHAAAKPSDALAQPLAKFREIRERMGAQEIRQYIGNSFIKQRLTTVLQECPSHYSAKMLLVQASGGRPTAVPRKVLAAEIRRALAPMDWVTEIEDYELSSETLARISPLYDKCRASLEPLQRYHAKPDQHLYDQAQEVAQAIREIDRAARARGESWDVIEQVGKARRNLKKLHESLEDTIAAELGETKR